MKYAVKAEQAVEIPPQLRCEALHSLLTVPYIATKTRSSNMLFVADLTLWVGLAETVTVERRSPKIRLLKRELIILVTR